MHGHLFSFHFVFPHSRSHLSLGNPPLGFLSFSVLINALILNLVAPIGIFIMNIIRKNRAPLMYMFFGFPVNGDRIQNEWGFVMEDFEEKKGTVSRKFIGFWDSIKRMYSGEGRVYTKDLREHPEEFQKELAIYRKAGTVWISYAVPFHHPHYSRADYCNYFWGSSLCIHENCSRRNITCST